MSEYAPLRDAFNELNRLLIDKQQWDAQHEQQTQEMGIKRMMVESQLQDQALKRKSLELESKQSEMMMAPREVNLQDFLPWNGTVLNTIENSPGLKANLAKNFGGTTLDTTTGRVLDDRGQVIKLPTFELGNRSVGAMALMHGALDPKEMIQANQAALSNAMTQKQNALNAIPDTPMNAKKRGELRTEINGLKAQWSQHEGMKTPDGMIDLLNKQLSMVQGFGTQATMMGANKNFSDLIKNYEDNINRQILGYQTEKLQRSKEKAEAVPITAYAIKLDADGMPIPGQTRMLSFNKGDYKNTDIQPKTVAKNLDDSWVWKEGYTPEKKGGGNTSESASAIRLWIEAVTKHRTAAFGEDGGEANGIIMDAPSVERNQIATKIQAREIPKLQAKYGNQLPLLPQDTVGSMFADMAKNVMDQYNYDFLTIWKSVDEDMEKAIKVANKGLNKKFQKEWGFIPDHLNNPYIFKGAQTFRNQPMAGWDEAAPVGSATAVPPQAGAPPLNPQGYNAQ